MLSMSSQMSSEVSSPMEHIDSTKDFASTKWTLSQPNVPEHPSSLTPGQHPLIQQSRFVPTSFPESQPKPRVVQDDGTAGCIPPESLKTGSGKDGKPENRIKRPMNAF